MKKLSENAKIAVIGGDARMVYCALRLSRSGFEVALYGFDKYDEDVGECTKCHSLDGALSLSELVILPMPVSRDGESLFMPFSENHISLEAVFAVIGSDKTVIGGNISDEVAQMAKRRGVSLVDYYEREELKIANAYLTAESAVGIAMNEMNTSIRNEAVLVVGYGRIGKALCQILKGMGANVYASARKKRDFEWIRSFGYSPVDTSKIDEVLSDVGIVFNTVPHRVLDIDKLKCVSRDTLIIDLASMPGGVDFDTAKKLGLRVIWALALPGKKLKKSAGHAIGEAIIGILEDEEAF